MLAPGWAAHQVSDMLYRPELAQDANREISTAINAFLMLEILIQAGSIVM